MAEWRRSPGVALGVLTGLNAFNYLDRYVAAASLPLILTGLGISDAEGGLLQSSFIITYALTSPAAGWIGDRQSRTHLAGLGVLIWSAATFASGLAPTYALLLCARAVTGVGEASYSVVTPSLLSDHYPPDRRNFALSVFYTAIPVGTALGYIVGGLVGEAHGWRAAFFVAGAPGAALAFLLITLREPPRGRFDPVSSHATTSLGLAASLKALAARRSYVANMLAQIIYTFALGGLATWMPTYFVRERGLALTTAASTFGILVVIAGFAGTLVGGVLANRLAAHWRGTAFAVSGWSLTISVVSTCFAVLSPHPSVFWPAMFVTLFLLFINFGPLNAAMANVLPSDLRARGFAVSTMAIHLLGDAISPWLIGLASERFGLTIPVLVTGALLTLSGLVLLAARADLDAETLSGDPAAPRTGVVHP